MQHASQNFPSPEVIGHFKTFGALGPAYQVIEPICPTEDGNDWWVRICVLESGEVASYKLTHLICDPEAK